MANHLFMRVDNHALDQWSHQIIEHGRNYKKEDYLRFSLFRRSLQQLPMRDLLMLYQMEVLNQSQESIAQTYQVCQSNVSYRKGRCRESIARFVYLFGFPSLTTVRNVLYQIGLSGRSIDMVLSLLSTSSQKTVGLFFNRNAGTVGYVFNNARDKLEKVASAEIEDSLRVLDLMDFVAGNFNRFRALTPQDRWSGKYLIHNTNHN